MSDLSSQAQLASLLAQALPQSAKGELPRGTSSSQLAAAFSAATLPSSAIQGKNLVISNGQVPLRADIEKLTLQPSTVASLLLAKVPAQSLASAPLPKEQLAHLLSAVKQKNLGLLLELTTKQVPLTDNSKQVSSVINTIIQQQLPQSSSLQVELLSLNSKRIQLSFPNLPETLSLPNNAGSAPNWEVGDKLKMTLQKSGASHWTVKLTKSSGTERTLDLGQTKTPAIQSNNQQTSSAPQVVNLNIEADHPLLTQRVLSHVKTSPMLLEAKTLLAINTIANLSPKLTALVAQKTATLVQLQAKGNELVFQQSLLTPKALIELPQPKTGNNTAFISLTSLPVHQDGKSLHNPQQLAQIPVISAKEVTTQVSNDVTLSSAYADNKTVAGKHVDVQVVTQTKVQAFLATLPEPIKVQVQQLLQQVSNQTLPATQQQPSVSSVVATLRDLIHTSTGTDKTQLQNIIKQLQTIGFSSEPALFEDAVIQDISKPSASNANKTESQQAQQIPTLLKSLFQSPALALSPTQISAPSTTSPFIAGLTTLLQLTLMSRITKTLPTLSEDTVTTSTNKTAATATQSASPKLLNDIANADSQNNLLKQLKSLLASHQHAKIKNAEQAIQGQDSFYYILPGTDQHRQPTEIMIRKEAPHQEQENHVKTASSQWNLTMKLDVGNIGEMLAKAKLTDSSIDLDVYTSSQLLLEKVADTLPLLLRRLTNLGLEIGHSKCQMGKIPVTLADRPYQILETKA